MLRTALLMLLTSALPAAVEWLYVRVTACSPGDPQDRAYYRRHGYTGGIHGVAADYRVLPHGTAVRVPGYLGGQWTVVDAPGGSVIRRSTRRGVYHVDVKFRTTHEAKNWGSRWLWLEVRRP